MLNNLNWENVETKWVEYEKLFEENFNNSKVVKLTKPKFDQKKISQLTFAFLYLYANQNEVITKKEMTEQYKKMTDSETNDFQAARHLGNRGYDVENYDHGINGYRLKSLKPRNDFFNNRTNEVVRGETIVTPEIFESIKKETGFICLVCTSEEGKLCRKPTSNCIVMLEMGHMDPRKKLTVDNCIPMCQYCNGVYKNKVVWDKNGNVIKTLI